MSGLMILFFAGMRSFENRPDDIQNLKYFQILMNEHVSTSTII